MPLNGSPSAREQTNVFGHRPFVQNCHDAVGQTTVGNLEGARRSFDRAYIVGDAVNRHGVCVDAVQVSVQVRDIARVGVVVDTDQELGIEGVELVVELVLPSAGRQDDDARQRADHQGVEERFEDRDEPLGHRFIRARADAWAIGADP